MSTSEVALAGGDRPLIKTKACGGPSAARRPIGVRFFRITTSPPPTVKTAIDDSTRLDPSDPPSNTRNHVCSVSRPLHHEAPVAAALDEAARQLVLQRRRLQAARSEVRSPNPDAVYTRIQKEAVGDMADCGMMG